MWIAMVPFVAVTVAVLAIAAGWKMRTWPAPARVPRGGAVELIPRPGVFRTTGGRIVVSATLTVLLVGLWLVYDLSIAFLPALMVPIWLPLFADRDLSQGAQRRLGIGLLVAGVLFLALVIVGVAVFTTT